MARMSSVIEKIGTLFDEKPDDLFLCSAHREEKCLGVVKRMDQYEADHAFIFLNPDTTDDDEKANAKELQERLSAVSNINLVQKRKEDPIAAIRNLKMSIQAMKRSADELVVTLDISSFTKQEVLLILRSLDYLQASVRLRILYTEPEDYNVVTSRDELVLGLDRITTVPTFEANYDPQKGLTLILFLGYEGDRALAVWENLEPNRTIAVVPKPAFRPGWEGRTEDVNSALLAALDTQDIHFADSLDPSSSVNLLLDLLQSMSGNKSNWYIATLGTKLQTVGVYYFIAQNRKNIASIIDVRVHGTKLEYLSFGIGPTWVVHADDLRSISSPS